MSASHGTNTPPQAAEPGAGESPVLCSPCDHHPHRLNLYVITPDLDSFTRLTKELGDVGLGDYDYSEDSDDHSGHYDDDYEDDDDDSDDDETEVYDDIQVRIRGQSHTVIKGDAFLELTADCDPYTRQNLSEILEDYFDFLGTDQAFARQQRDKIKGLSPTEKQALGVKVRDHIAKGRVFFCSFQPFDQDMSTIDSEVHGTLVKISYATDPVDKHVSQLTKECRLQCPEVVASYPGERQEPIGFVHLLEKVIQELYASRQKDIYCHGCVKTHEDVFEFEAVGKRKRTESTRLHVQSMAREIMKWVDFLSELYAIHLSVAETQGKMLEVIKKKLSHTKTRALW